MNMYLSEERAHTYISVCMHTHTHTSTCPSIWKIDSSGYNLMDSWGVATASCWEWSRKKANVYEWGMWWPAKKTLYFSCICVVMSSVLQSHGRSDTESYSMTTALQSSSVAHCAVASSTWSLAIWDMGKKQLGGVRVKVLGNHWS